MARLALLLNFSLNASPPRIQVESIFQNSGVCLLLPICAIAWDTNLEVLEFDLISVSREEGTEPEFSLWGSGIPSWYPR